MKTFNVIVRRIVYYYQEVEVEAEHDVEALRKAEDLMVAHGAWDGVEPSESDVEAMQS